MQESAKRSLDHWQMPLFNYVTLEDFKNGSFKTGIHTITEFKLPIDFFIKDNKSKNLLVSFSGAIVENKRPLMQLPIFAGTNISENIDYSVLAIADPSLGLDEKLCLSWYTGYKGLSFVKILRDIIESLITQYNFEKVVFLGGSGGGFAALNTGFNLPNSIVIAMNPQTEIARYSTRMVNIFTKTCFGKGNMNLIPDNIKTNYRMSLFNLYKSNHSNHILYLQNISDRHLSEHAIPFIEYVYNKKLCIDDFNQTPIQKINDKAIIVSKNWGNGHIPPDKMIVRNILKSLANTENFGDFFNNIALLDHLTNPV